MCGASPQQTQIEQQQQQFMSEAMRQQETSWGQDQDILAQMKSAYTPIFAKGPSQEGFSPEEKAALNTTITDQTAQGYTQAAQATNEQLAAQGGGNVAIPSGAAATIKGQLASSAASQEASARLGVTQASYQQGYQNWLNAATGMNTMAQMVSPTQFTTAATGTGNAAASTANQIAQENNSWVNAAIGAAGNIGAAALTGGMSEILPTAAESSDAEAAGAYAGMGTGPQYY